MPQSVGFTPKCVLLPTRSYIIYASVTTNTNSSTLEIRKFLRIVVLRTNHGAIIGRNVLF